MKIFNKPYVVALGLSGSLLFTSCEAIKNSNNTQRGVAIGAASGAVIGGILGNNIGKGGKGTMGAVLGGIVGGVAGGASVAGGARAGASTIRRGTARSTPTRCSNGGAGGVCLLRVTRLGG